MNTLLPFEDLPDSLAVAPSTARLAALVGNMAQGRPDDFQTPPAALAPLLPYLRPFRRIWEPACGRGNLVRALSAVGHDVTGTDILTGQNFFETESECDALVTNPPYSCKNDFLARCYALGKPFALLMPLAALESSARQSLYRAHGLECIFLPRRVNFETPSGAGTGAWFATAWFTHGMNLGGQMIFAEAESGGAQAKL